MGELPDERAEGASGRRAQALASDELLHPFSFERKHSSLRRSEAARPGVEILLARLAVPAPARALAADKPIERQLLLLGTEVLLNIDYYARRTRREERKQWAMNAGIYGLALVFVAFALYVFVYERDSAMAASSQIAAVVGAVLAGAKFVTEGQDFQKTRSSFWQAGAELKERLYLFLSEWCGRAWDEEAKGFSPEFVIAVQAEIKRARDIQVEERRRFYELMATPTRLLGATQQLSGEAQAAVTNYVQASQMREDQRRQHELEQVGKQHAELLQMYPDDATRPAAVVDRLIELEDKMARLSGQQAMTSVTAAVATAVTPAGTLAGGVTGMPYDGRRDP